MDGRSESAPLRVFLLDDHELVRRGVRELLESEGDIEVVGEAASAAEAMVRVPAVRPQVAVLDVRLPDGDGVTVCRDLRSQLPELACLMLTSFSDDDALLGAVMAGAARSSRSRSTTSTRTPAPAGASSSQDARGGCTRPRPQRCATTCCRRCGPAARARRSSPSS